MVLAKSEGQLIYSAPTSEKIVKALRERKEIHKTVQENFQAVSGAKKPQDVRYRSRSTYNR